MKQKPLIIDEERTQLARHESHDYEKFVDKFKTKKTTDDCYTPPEVYEAVLQWVRENADIEGLQVLRPFYPGGDYQLVDYTNAVVIDNPPFSILSKIKRFYVQRGVPFFLFAPHLMLFTSPLPSVTHIPTNVEIMYKNGAKVKTSFVSNLFGDCEVMTASELRGQIEKAQGNDNKTPSIPSYEYPDEVLTVSMLDKLINAGMDFSVKRNECSWTQGLSHQAEHGKKIFGAGYLLSKEKAAELRRLKGDAGSLRKHYVWELSDEEKEIVENLGK